MLPLLPAHAFACSADVIRGSEDPGLEGKWTEAYRQRNIKALTSLLADDFVITVEDGRVAAHCLAIQRAVAAVRTCANEAV